MPTQCPECGGAKTVHVAKYDRSKIPSHEHGSGNRWGTSDGDKWVRSQTLTAGSNSTTCRVCGGRGTL